MAEYLNIFFWLIYHAGYDFTGWYGILKENPKKFLYELIFRTIKLVLDYPVTIYLMFYIYGWKYEDAVCFYLLKQCGWADAFYIILWKLFNPGLNYTEEGLWWLWWTPWGAVKAVYQSIKDRKLSKGSMSLREFELQLALSLAVFVLLKLHILPWL